PLDGERLAEEATNGDGRSIRRRGRQDGFDARAVREASLEDGPLLVDVFPHELRRVAQRGDERLAGLEASLGKLQLSLALDEDLRWSVDHDVAHRRVLQERPDGSQELEQRLGEDFAGNHGTTFSSEPFASSACVPVGANRRYSRKWLSALARSCT